MSNELLKSLPTMFETMHQKAAMCSFLWTNDDDPKTIVYNLRLYDLVRRLYYVKTHKEPTPERVLELISFVKENKEINDFLMHFCKLGRFPDNNTLKYIKY